MREVKATLPAASETRKVSWLFAAGDGWVATTLGSCPAAAVICVFALVAADGARVPLGFHLVMNVAEYLPIGGVRAALATTR